MLMKCNANISIPGGMRNANVMQMKCIANKCEKMHNSGSDPLIGVYQITSRNLFVDTLENNIISDSAQIEIP